MKKRPLGSEQAKDLTSTVALQKPAEDQSPHPLTPPSEEKTEYALPSFVQEEAPTRIADRYRVLSLLGQGGGGSVYRVHDEELDEEIALKMLRGPMLADQQVLKRFRQEVKLARKITHPNISRIFDLGQSEDGLFLTMEYIEGYSLRQVLKVRDRLPPEEVLGIALQLCAALKAAHTQNILHRDIKPANILINAQGHAILLDFGVAQTLREAEESNPEEEGRLFGTPYYMAPEQMESTTALDQRADIFAFGVVLYELLSGQHAWNAKSLPALLAQRLTQAPIPLRKQNPALPSVLCDIVERCMANEITERYDDIGEVEDLLRLQPIQAKLTAYGMGDAVEQSPKHRQSTSQPTAESRLQSWIGTFKKVAVLPMVPRGERIQEGWPQWLQEDLIDLLSMNQNVQINPRGAVAHLAGTEPLEAGRRLKVEAVVSGTYQQRTQEVVLSLRLATVHDGLQLWAKRWQGSEQEALSQLESWTGEILQALTMAQQKGNHLHTSDRTAIELYYQARQALRLNWYGDLSQSLSLFHEALMRAPEDPVILSFAAVAHARRAFYRPQHDKEQRRLAQEYVERALKRAPRRGEPYFAQALMMFSDGRLRETLQHLHKAIDHAPIFADAYEYMGRVLLECGPLETAIAWLERAQAMDPGLLHVRWDLARAYALARRFDDADALLAMDVPPQGLVHRAMVRARIDCWRPQPRWLDDLKTPPTFHSRTEQHVWFSAQAYRDACKSQQLPPELAKQLHESTFQPVNLRLRALRAQRMAELQCTIGNIDAFFVYMEHAYNYGFRDLVWLQHCARLDGLRDDSRFQTLLQQIEQELAPALHDLDEWEGQLPEYNCETF